MRITLSRKEAITLFIVIALIKAGVYVYPALEPHFAESAYIAVTNELDKRTVQDMEAEMIERTSNLYIIGRPSCIDCRVAIKNIKRLYRICNKEADQRMYYVRLKDKITDSERKFLDSISVDNIPTIVTFKDGAPIAFEYDDINSENFTDRFQEFLNSL